LALTLGTAGCLYDPRGSVDEFTSVVDSDHAVDRAMSALSKGDYSTAETYALAALRRNPKDPYALLVAGIAYQNSGRYDLARQYYDVILTNKPNVMLAIPDATGTITQRPVLDIARTNMDAIDKIMGRNLARSMAESGAGAGAGLRPMPLTGAEASVSGRFRILKRLLDEDLITPDEYNTRRTANLGALLPLSMPTPGVGLERPIPADIQVVDRLKSLKAAIEAREMLPREAASERQTILDALLPGAPKSRSIPPLPPKDMLDAAESVGRLERLQTQGLITPDEAAKERAAIDRALQTQASAHPVEGTATGLKYGPLPEQPKPKSEAKTAKAEKAAAIANWGVGLGSAPSEAEAKALADQIKGKFPEELANQSLTVRKITVKGKERWQVVGSVPNHNDARHLCKLLKLHRQGCDPVGLD
jgi:tetratricopeptide (TPR) repeat protein